MNKSAIIRTINAILHSTEYGHDVLYRIQTKHYT